MKKLKNIFLVVALLLFSTYFAPIFAGFSSKTAYASPSNFSYISIENFEDETNVGGVYIIPTAKLATVSGGSVTYNSNPDENGITVSVKDPLNRAVTVNSNSFEVEKAGDYTITYQLTLGGSTFSHSLKVRAIEGKYSFEFEQNSKQIIPSHINPSWTKKVVLPMPKVLDINGDEVTSGDVVVRVLEPSATEYLSSDKLTKNQENYYEFLVDIVGVWTIEYLYMVDNKILHSQTKTITADNNFDNNYELLFNFEGTKPTTAITGVELTLPKVTGKNSKTNDAVEVYYEISARVNKGNGYEAVDNSAFNGNVFVPPFDGDYEITYTIKDFFGHLATSGVTFPIYDVKDTKAPVVRMVNAYTAENLPAEDDDASFNLPAKTSTKNVVFPAIWANDNVSNKLEDFVLTRKIVKTTGEVVYESSTDPNKELVFNYDENSGFVFDSTKQIKVETELKAGTYNVIYTAEDKAGNVSESVNYSIVLSATFVDDKAPELSWSETQEVPTQAKVGEKLTILAPTVKDDNHTRNRVTFEYFFYNGIAPTASDWKVVKAVDGKYTIEVEKADELWVRATAVDAHNNSASIKKEIDIIDTNDENQTIITTYTEPVNLEYVQGRELNLPSVTYEDDFAEYVQVGYYVTVEIQEQEEGQTVTKTIPLNAYDDRMSITFGTVDNDVIVVENAKVFASFAGDYKITIVSKDYANNYTIFFYEFPTVTAYQEDIEIGFTKLPTSLNGGKIELGETIKLPTASVNAPQGATVEPYEVTKRGPSSEKTILNNFEFKPGVKGVYEIEYRTRVDLDGNPSTTDDIIPVSKVFRVEVVDTTGPTISDFYVEPVVPVNYELEIPYVTASDLSGVDLASSKIVLTSTKFGSRTLYFNDTTSTRKITLGYNEVYTLTVTAYDIHGNSSTLTKTIKVGDTEAPVITVNETDKKFVPETMNIGDTLTLDLGLISVSDLVDKNLTVKDLKVVVTRDGEEIKNIHGDSKERYAYKIEQAGEYTVRITVEDAAGNVSTPVVRTFTVSATENPGVEVTEVVGTILIVVSVLLLAGVIVYFVVTKKKTEDYR